jgi:multidrug efflux pump subunit AcrA (membrane-fusion protein)
MNLSKNLSVSLFLSLIALGCNPGPESRSETRHPVMVSEIEASPGTILTVLPGMVRRNTDSGTTAGIAKISTYRIEVPSPRDAEVELKPGESVSVTLPIIRHNEVRARVDRIVPGKIELLLPDQVQELSGQQVQVKVPLRSSGVYQLPFWAVYSPRGLTQEVFLLQGDQAHLVPIEVVGPADRDGRIWVTGPKLAPGAQVVVHGLDNLVSGDRVQVVSEKELLQ